mmetsp:Transcript_106192/g.297289  ORF Transcript_106192/g.297289 Transcript_106192/m.297289 type:complete len:280 (-) Transcript_106192:113-952(-)
MAANGDLEWSLRRGDGLDESSEESDGHPMPTVAVARCGRAARVGAVGALATVVFMCIMSFRGTSPVVARASGATGLSANGKAALQAALQAADSVEHQGFGGQVVPQEHLHDGNPCGDDEEFHAGLCYEKCALLTGGAYVHRQSPWTCCNQATCSSLFKLSSCCRHNMGMCSGYDIAGMEEGQKVCPHNPGACLADEELFLDVCYMKCSLLTNGQYPYRTASATCCKSKGLGCMIEDGVMDGLNGQAITNSSLNVGGGCGDSSNKTKCEPHAPEQQLTEA